MTPDVVVALGREAAGLAVALAGPVLLAALVAGVLVSVFQAATQIQELTLSFVPKLAAVLAVLLLLGHWMLARLVGFTVDLLGRLDVYGR